MATGDTIAGRIPSGMRSLFLEYRLPNITITFCGHSTLYDEGVKEALYDALMGVLSPLSASDKVTFLCGGYGAFDSLCSNVIDELRRQGIVPKNEKLLVTPYLTESYKERLDLVRKYYDDVIFPPIENAPLRFAIPRRNVWMVEQADIVIAYVRHSMGGAATTLRHAYSKKKNIIRLITDYDIR